MIAATNMKVNGKWYAPGEEIPEVKVEVARDYAKPTPIVVDKPIVESVKAPYKRNDILRMSVKDLRKVGTKYGLKHADDMTGAEIKAWLLEKFGL